MTQKKQPMTASAKIDGLIFSVVEDCS